MKKKNMKQKMKKKTKKKVKKQKKINYKTLNLNQITLINNLKKEQIQ